MTIQIKTHQISSWKVACLQGRVDAFNDKRILHVLRQMMDNDGMLLAVDLSQVDFIGFYALQELVKMAEELKSRTGELALVGPTAQVRRHLDSFAGHRGLRVFRDLEELRGGLFLKPRSEHGHHDSMVSP